MFGRRSLATATIVAMATMAAVPQVAVAGVGAMPAARQTTRVGYSPRPQVAVGDGGGCGTPQIPGGNYQNTSGVFCNNMLNSSPIPMGSGIASIPAAAAGVNGTATVTLQSVEGFTLYRITVTTNEPMLLITNIQAGRALFMESGQVAADLFRADGCCCGLLEGFNIWPSVGVSFTFGNPSSTVAAVIVSLTGFPMPCPQGNRPN